MSEFVFTSPGVKFRERDISFVTRSVGITTLGTVGETTKGPAFEPVFIQDMGQFEKRFGNLNNEKYSNGNLRYQVPYVSNSYLQESSQLWVTRVLGLNGYDAGDGWAITLSSGVDLSTTGNSTTTTFTDVFTNNIYRGTSVYATGDTGNSFDGFIKTGTNFAGDYHDFVVTSIDISGSGTTSGSTTVITGTSLSEYENMVLAVIRSRGTVSDVENGAPIYSFEADNLEIIGNNTITGTGDMYNSFKIRATNSIDSSSEEYIVSLNPNSREFITNVIGNKPKDKNKKIYVESIYPDLIAKLDGDSIGYGVNTDLIELKSNTFTDYKEQFQTPETPWIVSELRGNDISRLFKFVSISDGSDANKEVKISIQNVDPTTKEFDVIIRDFNDKDDDVSILESYSRCTMRKSENNYIGNRIGTSDGEYDLTSNYIMVEISENAPEDSFPCGFEGYNINDYASSATTTTNGIEGIAPKLFYKKSYDTNNDKYNRVYLGISEKGYDSETGVGDGINQNLFNYQGRNNEFKIKGFHLDIGATGNTDTSGNTIPYMDGKLEIGLFETGVGELRTSNDINSSDDVYYDEKSRKFTLVPYGGFDGWDEHRTERTYTDLYRKGGIFDGVNDGLTPMNDFQAWETAIRTFSNPEEVTINLFTTPGINWSDNNVLINNTIEMIENDRTDSLYIIDSLDIDIDAEVGGDKPDVLASKEVADLLDIANIDSNYSATYFPYIQQKDNYNNVNIWIPSTGEVVKAIAYTDKVAFPWYAPAGLQRGSITARKAKYKMSLEARDIIYKGRINPIVDFIDVGTTILGQKTLQLKESALDRINVRRLLLQIKVIISNIAVRTLFEQNDQTTIDQFLGQVNPILDNIKNERGLENFNVKMDDTNNTPETRDRNELFGEIYIKPTKSVEFIGIGFTITPSGASFENI